MARQIVLDTETTGLEPSQGHRIIEIGCVEMVDRRLTRRTFHQYLQPDREIDQGAIEVHGITNEFLADKPRFGDIARDFMDFVQDAELVIHNAPFDVGFLNHELKMLGAEWGSIEEHCRILDTLALARELHPGQRNNLDALCKRYSVDNSNRELHGALLDAEILADVYLMMTGGQVALSLDADMGGETEGSENKQREQKIRRLPAGRPALRIIPASDQELQAHRERLVEVEKASGGNLIWQNLPDQGT